MRGEATSATRRQVVLDAMSQRQIPVGVRAEASGQEVNEHPDRRREVAGVRIDGANREVLRDKRVEDCGEGAVTLPCEERERSTPCGFLSRRDGLTPRGHRRGA